MKTKYVWRKLRLRTIVKKGDLLKWHGETIEHAIKDGVCVCESIGIPLSSNHPIALYRRYKSK